MIGNLVNSIFFRNFMLCFVSCRDTGTSCLFPLRVGPVVYLIFSYSCFLLDKKQCFISQISNRIHHYQVIRGVFEVKLDISSVLFITLNHVD